MIRIRKPADPPTTLRRHGSGKTQRLCTAFKKQPETYCSGRKTFTFKKTIYASKSVKQTLIRAQHGKCCYCEAKVTYVSHGNIEHFRPKAGFCQNEDDDLIRPGYYWLAYDWQNLYLSCEICNQICKRSFFPLANPERRALSHRDSIESEEPLLIDPAEEAVEQLIGFRGEYPYAIDGCSRAVHTIRILGLDGNNGRREALIDARRTKLRTIKILIDNLELLNTKFPIADRSSEVRDHMDNIICELETAVANSAEFAAMARSAINPILARFTQEARFSQRTLGPPEDRD